MSMTRRHQTGEFSRSARSIALAALVGSVDSEEGADVLLDRQLSSSSLDGRDRSLAMELAFGVLRRQGTIDWRLGRVVDRPIPRLPILIQMILRIGAYQLLYLDRIPPSAAVNESVNLAKTHAPKLKRDWSGFVNAVLRSLLREPAPPWPSDPAAAIAVRCSVPEWLSRRWIDRLGYEKAEEACEQTSSIPPVTLRAHQLRNSREELLARFHRAGISARPTSVSPLGIIVEGAGPVSLLPGFPEGAFYVEDEAAQLVPPLLDPHPDLIVVDACAAPGGKSLHLADIMQNRGILYSIDRSKERLERLRENCHRLGASMVTPIRADIRMVETWADETGSPDGILVDAPCSGLGVLRRHPEAKWKKDTSSLDRHHRHQLEIIRAVAPRLRPGGVLVYSTCSTEPEENESVIDQFLKAHAEFRRESVAPWLPPAGQAYLTERGDLSTMGNRIGMDGFYAARLRRQD